MTGRILRGGAAALMLLLATSLTPEPASATTFAELTVEQFTDASTWIVEGEVVRVWTETDEARGYVWTKAQVKVDDVHKGPSVPRTIVVDSLGGTDQGITMTVPGQAVFSPGESVFLFLDQIGERIVPVSKFQGKLTIRRAPGERRSHAMRWHPSATEAFDHRFLPHPPAEQRVYLDTLRAQVQARLDVGWDGKPIPGLSRDRLEQINQLERRLPR